MPASWPALFTLRQINRGIASCSSRAAYSLVIHRDKPIAGWGQVKVEAHDSAADHCDLQCICSTTVAFVFFRTRSFASAAGAADMDQLRELARMPASFVSLGFRETTPLSH